MSRHLRSAVLILVAATVVVTAQRAPSAPLASWRDGAVKTAIVSFVRAATDRAGRGFVAPAERIAVFDNDGTLWAEQPVYFALAFAFDRVRVLAPSHPEWKGQEPFRSLLAGDVASVAAAGEKAIGPIIAATHAGMSTDEFATTVHHRPPFAFQPAVHLARLSADAGTAGVPA